MKREEKSKQTLFLVKTGKYSKIFVNARALWEERVKAEKQGTSSGNPQHQNVIPRCQECPKVKVLSFAWNSMCENENGFGGDP